MTGVQQAGAVLLVAGLLYFTGAGIRRIGRYAAAWARTRVGDAVDCALGHRDRRYDVCTPGSCDCPACIATDKAARAVAASDAAQVQP